MSMKKNIAGSSNTVGRFIRATILTAMASVFLTIASGGVAHANLWQLSDGFDSNPSDTWYFETYGVSGAGFDINAGTARSAPNNAYLWSQTNFSAVGRYVTLRNNSYRDQCAAGIHIQGMAGAKVNVEIIDPKKWVYVSLKTATINSSGYTKVLVPAWTGGPNTVYFRVSLLNGSGFSMVRVDDLVVQCTY
ncbi:MAG: hypothetical protein JXR76_21475 [Deltaproteobacteria bacterium]|nr:hypothetical protein [Deltaproteobacteria bacterium]